VRNNPYAERAIRVIAANTVGTGIIPQAKIKRVTSTAHEDLWIEWGDSTLCDFDGKHDFYGLQNLVIRTVAESGECLIRRHRKRSRDGLPVPLQMQLLEPDHIDSERNEELSNGGRIIRGIEVNRKGQVTGYWLFEDHPGSQHAFSQSLTSKRVPASDILHVYRVDRVGQLRGVPWAAPIILRLRDLDEYEDAQLIRQKIASCFSAFVEDVDDMATDKDMELLERLEPGMIERLPPGKRITFGNPPKVEGYSDHTRSVVRSIAMGYGVTYESISGDLSQVNFSSARMGWLEFQRNIDQWRYFIMIPQFCKPVWRWFLEAGELAGKIKTPAVDLWTPPKREMIDPVKETNALKNQVRSGFKSQSEAIRSMGKDPIDVYEEIKEDYKLMDDRGIVLDSDPRKGQIGGG
jgi:lambda family phage portal protein